MGIYTNQPHQIYVLLSPYSTKVTHMDTKHPPIVPIKIIVDTTFAMMENQVNKTLDNHPEMSGFTVDDMDGLIVLVMCQYMSFFISQCGKDSLSWIMYLGQEPISSIDAVKRELTIMYGDAGTAGQHKLEEMITKFCTLYCERLLPIHAKSWGLIIDDDTK